MAVPGGQFNFAETALSPSASGYLVPFVTWDIISLTQAQNLQALNALLLSDTTPTYPVFDTSVLLPSPNNYSTTFAGTIDGTHPNALENLLIADSMQNFFQNGANVKGAQAPQWTENPIIVGNAQVGSLNITGQNASNFIGPSLRGYVGGGTAILQAYDTNLSAYMPVYLQGSTPGLEVGNTVVLSSNSTYVVNVPQGITTNYSAGINSGAFYAMGTGTNPSTGQGVYLNGGATPLIRGYDFGASADLPVTLRGSTVTLTGNGATSLTAVSGYAASPTLIATAVGPSSYPTTGTTAYLTGGSTPTLRAYNFGTSANMQLQLQGSSVLVNGALILSSNAATAPAGQISIGSNTAAASNCNQGGTLTSVSACIVVNVAGTTHYVPYF
jgi:hypothetical protein